MKSDIIKEFFEDEEVEPFFEDYEKELEAGRKKVHEEGYTFQKFQTEVNALLTKPIKDQDAMVNLFNDYAELKTDAITKNTTLQEFIAFHLMDWTEERHGTEVKAIYKNV